MGRVYAGVLGSLAFATIVCRAVLLGGAADSTLRSACTSALIFAILGWLAGTIADQTLTEAVRQRFQEELRARGSADEVPRTSGGSART